MEEDKREVYRNKYATSELYAQAASLYLEDVYPIIPDPPTDSSH